MLARILKQKYLIGLLLFLGVARCSFSPQTPSSTACAGWPPPDAIYCLRQNQSALRWPAAHRGDQSTGEENSTASISRAVEQHFPLIEVDIRKSLDEVLFLYHDRRFQAGKIIVPAGISGKSIESLSSSSIETIQTAPYGSKIIKFVEALQIVRPSHSKLLLDLKGESIALIDSVLNVLDANDARQLVTIQCQTMECVSYIRGSYSEMSILFRAKNPNNAATAIPYRPEIIQLDEEFISPFNLGKIKTLGARILVKTLTPETDTREHWNNLFSQGVDIILTDHPSILISETRLNSGTTLQ